jgi:hypothetical protein
LLTLGDPDLRRGFEAALSPLAPGKDVEPVLGPALEALVRVPPSALQWANDLADATLDPLVTTPRASTIAASAVKFYARAGRPGALDPWLDIVLQPRALEVKERKAPKAELPSIEDDPAALSGLVARLVQKNPDSPPVAQLVAALVGLARERPDCATIQPFVDHFVHLIGRPSESAAVTKLGEAFASLLTAQPDSAHASRVIEQLVASMRERPDQAWVATFAHELARIAREQPDSTGVASLVAMRNAAHDAGVGLFARRILDHPALREKADDLELEAFARSFDGRRARRALIHGLIDTLCNDDILRNRPKGEVVATLERDLVDVD